MNRLFEGKNGKDRRSSNGIFNLGYHKKNVHNLSQSWSIFGIAFILVIAWLTNREIQNLPPALGLKDEQSNPNTFIGERAWTDLRILNGFGPRVIGSYANEVLTVDFLKREIAYIQQNSHKNQKIYSDIQLTSGSFFLDQKPYGTVNVYRNLQNIAVKLIGKSEGNDNSTLLVNCHFDTVPGSPGASDDGVNCCVMLETLRILSKQSQLNQHSIIFLFNGGEELSIQSSHGFITQHPWASSIKAFINYEAAGANGREILFQAGSPWLIDIYQSAARWPYGQACGEEIFQSGLVPSDTDYRIFRDFGNIPGMDFAHYYNGYVYHTKYDHINSITMAVLQQTGNNMLDLVKGFANSKQLTDPKAYDGKPKVYFDILGYGFISYSKDIGVNLNMLVAILAVLVPYLFFGQSTKGIHSKHIRKEILFGCIVNFLSTKLSLLTGYAIGYELNATSNTMTWFHHKIISIALYSFPTVLIQCILHRLFNQRKESPLSLALKVQARINGTCLSWSLILIGLTLKGSRSGYIIMIPLLLVTVANFIIGALGIQNSIKKWLYVHLIGQIFVIIWTTYIYHLFLNLLIPITGRSGYERNPELLIGLLTCALTIFITSFMTPLIGLLNRTRNLLFGLAFVFIFTRIFVISMTDIGFPYRDETSGFPTPQRHYISHTIRTLYDQNGNVRYTDSGYWFRELDSNARKTIESLVAPDIAIKQSENALCAKEIFCGLPVISIRTLLFGGYWLPGPAPIIREPVTLKLSKTKKIDEYEKELSFTVYAQPSVSLSVRPKKNVQLIKWSLTPEIPRHVSWNNDTAYFAFISHGSNAAPLNITMSFRVDKLKNDGPIVDVTLVSFNVEYHKEHTPAFAKLLAKMPKWTVTTPIVSSLDSWTF